MRLRSAGGSSLRGSLLVVLLVLLAACAGVPGSSEPVAVRHVNGTDAVGEDPDVQVVPPGPTPHMSTRDVVDGFLKASSSGVDARHQVARRFLTPAAAVSWDDTAQSTVYNEPLVDDRPGGGSVTVTVGESSTTLVRNVVPLGMLVTAAGINHCDGPVSNACTSRFAIDVVGTSK